jgi:outer membrane protein OmpA-like peptidoglycan-associated protein/uncharacterized membrane protein YeaQ/YmgE (transglycosylase-associated protein family)
MEWLMGIAVLAILGLIVGAIAKSIMPGDDPGGIVTTSILGIVGAMLGGVIGNALGIGGITGLDWRSLVTAVIGSLLLLLAYRAFRMLTPGVASSPFASGRSSSTTPLRAYGQTGDYDSSTVPNLAELAKSSISNEVVSRLSEKVGENSSSIRKALEAMIPTVLASVRSQVATPSGASRLFDVVKGAAQGGLERQLADGNLDGIGRQCQGFLSTLFGDKLAGLLNWLAGFAGIRESSASSLMNVASSMVMSTLGRTIQQQGLDASQFAGLLSTQSSWLSRLLPSGITDLPGMRTLADVGDRAAEVTHAATAAGRRVGAAAERAYQETVGIRSPLLSALLPLGLLLLAIPLLGWLMRGAANIARPPVEDVAVRPAPRQALATETPPAPVADAPRRESTIATTLVPTTLKLSELRLPDGVSLQVPESSFLNTIYKYLSDPTAAKSREFVFEGLEFADAKIHAIPETETAVKSLSKLIRAFPSVTLRIVGHTDPSGDPVTDQRISLARADSLKDLLVKAGVPNNRIVTAGLGSDHPVASNDTSEGRVKNRRIELSLSKSP